MVKVGDKVVVVSAPDWRRNCSAGDVLEVFHTTNNYGFWARSINGKDHYVRMAGMDGHAEVIVRPYTESEAEKRGAKFGAMGVVKATGRKWVFVKEVGSVWWGLNEDGFFDSGDADAFRLDHEPEFVAWMDAPEELKYDASRVYYRGKLVRWIAKPEGANSPKVVYMMNDGNLSLMPYGLTVKL